LAMLNTTTTVNWYIIERHAREHRAGVFDTFGTGIGRFLVVGEENAGRKWSTTTSTWPDSSASPA